MTVRQTRFVIRWPSAAVLIAGIVTVAAVYVYVPDHRTEIALGVGGLFTVALAFMRRILGVAVALCLAVAIPLLPGCTIAEQRTALTALELARKIGCDVLCPADETP